MVSKAVILAGGRGVRMLPITKAIPKQMLPILDKPVLHYIVEEMMNAGISKIAIIINPDDTVIRKYFSKEVNTRRSRQDVKIRKRLQDINTIIDSIEFNFIIQDLPRGIGHAIGLAETFVSDEPFLVAMGDSLISHPVGQIDGSSQLINAFKATSCSTVAVSQVSAHALSRYGIADCQETHISQNIFRVSRFVEKPSMYKAPSNLAVSARYIFTNDIFSSIRNIKPHKSEELHLTHAINILATKQPVYAYKWNAIRYDIGNIDDYAKCFVKLALENKIDN